MKKTLLYTSIIVLGALAAASCNLNNYPVFDDNDAFVAFGSTTAQFTEPAEPTIVEVNVTLASVAGIATNVSYEVLDSTAKAGVDYELVDETGVLRFDAENRTCPIQIRLLNPNYGEYTGNKVFSIRLTSTGSVNLGAEKTCLVTIADADHPLAPILGTYQMEGESYFNGPVSWNLTIERDPDGDVTMVWFENLIPGGYGGFYGTVTSENNMPVQIDIPLGQVVGGTLYGCDVNGEYIYSAGNIPVAVTNSGNTITFTELGPALNAEGNSYYEIMKGGCFGNKVQ